ncbi:MAG: hypothetical protein G01um101449_407 [Parcubacteria group bacterium Gr01-1014_49]|nr:MAG: hypothetical protein G01um101449_407 [Parcubacteria group bacterium Gr01-1014_49]
MSRLSPKPQNGEPRSLFILYEPGHVEALERLWRRHPEERSGSLVIALSLDVEAKLAERNIVFSSGREYKRPSPDLLKREDEMMKAFFVDSRWSSFTYRGIELRATFLFMFRAYLQRVWYYGNLLISIVERHASVRRIVVFAPGGKVSSVAGGLAVREVEAVVDCAETVAAACNMPFALVPSLQPLAPAGDAARIFLFNARRTLFGFFLKAWNATISATLRPRHPRLVISDYWRNMGSSIESLGAGECTFLDRTEIRNIPWRMLLRYRMRFVHSEDFLSSDMRKRAEESAQEFSRQWGEMRREHSPVVECRGYSFDVLLLRAVDDIVRGFEKLLCGIEGTYALYERIRPDVVLLRASASVQTHFSVLPLVAKQCGIPSLELQHGLEYLGAGSLSREHLAEHIAVYGSLVKKEFLSLGYAPERVHETGSPRFDTHRAVAVGAREQFTVLCIAPDIRPFDIYDSYSAEEYLSAVAAAAKTIPNVHVIIKLRAGPAGEVSLRAAIANSFSRVPHTIAQGESLAGLLARSDAVVSCYSTAILEALQYALPVVIPALNPVDAEVVQFHFLSYRNAGALDIAFTHGELSDFLTEIASDSALRRERQLKIRAFLADNFCFDGKSSSRFVALIVQLAKKSTLYTSK